MLLTQWDDIKAMRVGNYNRIDGVAGGKYPPATDDNGPATDHGVIEENPKHIGLIAQGGIRNLSRSC